VRAEVADTVSAPHEIEGELRYLHTALAEKLGGFADSVKPRAQESE
jgi:hypothetical protein